MVLSSSCADDGDGPLSIELPADIRVPVLVYGFLKPDELSYPVIQRYVEHSKPAQVRGSLRIRDGLPLLVPDGAGIVNGSLLSPNEHLYRAMCEFEPGDQYRWQVMQTIDGENANVLIGKKPHAGSSSFAGHTFLSRDDILLVDGPTAVRHTLDRSNGAQDVSKFFATQMAYLFLWSIIERFMALRYGPHLEAGIKIKKFGADPTWQSAIKRLSPTAIAPIATPVVDSRTPTRTFSLDVKKPLGTLQFFYQFRCNLTHRGKAAMSEAIRLGYAAELLMSCLQLVWEDNRIEWRGGRAHQIAT